MANTLTIAAPSSIGGSASFITLRFTVTSGATTISDTYYNFHANDFSNVYDFSTPNVAVLHLGSSHVFTMSNGDYSTIVYDGSTQATIATAAAAVVSGVASFTT